MQTKKTLLIEIGIVGLILIILCGVMLPKFLSSQRSGEPYRLIKNLQVLVDAIKEYQHENGGVPSSIVKPKINIRPMVGALPNYVYNQFNIIEFEKPYQFLFDMGYIDELPKFDELNGFIESDLHALTNFRIPINMTIYGLSLQSNTDKQFLEEFYIYHPWFKTEPRKMQQFFHQFDRQNPKRLQRPSVYLFGTDGYWMHPELFYSPSNGMNSAGFIYVDSEGNHSPWN